MSRRFTSAEGDFLTYNLPTTPAEGPVNFASGTIIVIARFVTAPGWASFIEFRNSSGEVKSALGRRSNDGLYWSDGGSTIDSTMSGTGGTFTIGTADNWCLYAMVRPAGANQPLTFHKIPLATASRSTHTTDALSQFQSGGVSGGQLRIGGNADFFDGRMGVIAIIPDVYLTGTDLDGIVSSATTQSILNFTQSNAFVTDQADSFAANLVAANTPLTTDSGTSADADNPTWTFGAGPPGGVAPANTVAPAITGTAETAQQLSCSTGTWTGDPAPTFAYQWKRNGANIAGATSNTYTLVQADEGTTVLCTVTATNASGSASANSNSVTPTAPPVPPPPAGSPDVYVRWAGAWVAVEKRVMIGGVFGPFGDTINITADLTGLDNGEILIWDGTDGRFEPGAP